MSETYRQCRLQSGRAYQTAWIPATLASHGRLVTLGDDPLVWTVIDVGEQLTPRETIDTWRDQWKQFERVLA